ncbi:hypothetical protein B0181_04785 [Moraxella caviae]|uniref:ABC transporter substrate-binding protein n=1 Tax=Moraxella caviae TaxID=34060 RepID=A0A1T0A394_9GAMM|nr:hypothetical protein [Moraxella caviae]OOR90194.1 hypothetical protein B0181_04785 [Moraxella caviae]STZ14588.1 Uncharacterised protein [Moraxella caviae]VEW11357.1 Uncharacterised protein [Moraxella caviae]
MNIIKTTLVAATLAFASVAQAADWTPMFRHLEQGKKGDGGKALRAFATNIVSYKEKPNATPDDYWQFSLVKKYKLSAPYSKDVRQAITIDKTSYNALAEAIGGGGSETAWVPTQGATLYGKPIKGFIVWQFPDSDNVGFYVNFGKMSQKSFNLLKRKAKFERYYNEMYGEVDSTAEFKRVNGYALLSVE